MTCNIALTALDYPNCSCVKIGTWAWMTDGRRRDLTRSMSKKGCSPDNSACEGFFGRIKNEVFYGRDWKGWNLDDFMYFIDRYLNWFRNERIKIGLNNKSLKEYRTELGLLL